jgi:type IV pilus assembly protein PilY1
VPLRRGTHGCSGQLDGLFVVALDSEHQAALQELHDLADAGGTGEAIVVSELLEDDRIANHVDAVVAALAEALDRSAPSTNTRAVPAFARSRLGSTLQTQSQINAGFRIGQPGEPWEGVLERQRFVCDSDDLQPRAAPIQNDDRFHEVLNSRGSPRRLLTVLPNDLNNLERHLAGEDTGIAPMGAGGPGGGGGGGRPRGVGGRSTTCGGNPGGGGGGGGRRWRGRRWRGRRWARWAAGPPGRPRRAPRPRAG